MLPQKRWTYLEADENVVNELQKQLNIHPILCKLLVLRNIKTFEEAKAEVSGAYQEYESKRLENEYIDSLKKKYSPVIYYDELRKAFTQSVN